MAKLSANENKIHLVRRQNPGISYPLFVRIIAIFVSLLLIVLIFSSIGKFSFPDTISYMQYGAFGNQNNTSNTFLNMMYLLVLALGLAPAYKMKFWNTGALGQALIGNLFSAVIIYKLGPLIPSNFLLLLVAFVTAVLGGAIWGIIPGIFKAKIGANETLFTLMSNYVAIKLCEIVIDILKGGEQQLSPSIYGRFDPIGGDKFGVVYIIVALVAIFVFIYLKYTKHGYELTVVGESKNTAKYAGIDVGWVTMRTAAISGAICAICGFLSTGVNTTLSTTSDGGFGFTSIIVTWSSHFSLLGMIIISFLIAIIKQGSDGVKDKASKVMNAYASYVSIGIFLFFLIGCEFFLNYKFVRNKKVSARISKKREELKEKNPALYNALNSFSMFCTSLFVIIDQLILKVKQFFIDLMGKCLSKFKKPMKEGK